MLEDYRMEGLGFRVWGLRNEATEAKARAFWGFKRWRFSASGFRLSGLGTGGSMLVVKEE